MVGFQDASFTSGYDAVVLPGSRNSYAIQVSANGVTAIKDIGVGDASYGQTVTVSGESYLIFNGASSTTVAGLPVYSQIYFIETPDNAQLAQFFAAATQFKTSIALAGLEYWQGALSSGMSLTSIAQSFLDTSYFQTTYGSSGTTHAQHVSYVEALYSNILGMNLGATDAGVQYWANDLDSGVLSAAQTLISFTNATTTTSTINAMSGATAGIGIGWLIDPSLTGGYADPGLQIAAQTALSQAAVSNFYNLSLIDPNSLTNAGVSANGITLTPGTVQLGGTTTTGTVVTLSPSFSQATIAGSGYTLHDGPGSDSITVSGAHNVIFVGSATTDRLDLAFGTNTSVAGFTPGKGSVLAVSGTINETAVSLLNGTTTAVHGSSLAFGTASAATAYFVNIGGLGDGSATSVAAAANAAYLVADVTGNAGTGALGEHVIFIGTDSGGDTEIWSFRGPLTSFTVNSQAMKVPIAGADTSGTHAVIATDITLIATLIGVPATNLTAADLA